MPKPSFPYTLAHTAISQAPQGRSALDQAGCLLGLGLGRRDRPRAPSVGAPVAAPRPPGARAGARKREAGSHARSERARPRLPAVRTWYLHIWDCRARASQWGLAVTVSSRGTVLGLFKESALGEEEHSEKGLAKGGRTWGVKDWAGKPEPQTVGSWPESQVLVTRVLRVSLGRREEVGLESEVALDRGPEPEMQVWPKFTGSLEDLLWLLSLEPSIPVPLGSTGHALRRY